jgi:hypothetical protein
MIPRTTTAFVHRLRKAAVRFSIDLRLLTIAAIALSVISCEDVIEIDLNNVEPRIVIEGVITDRPASVSVRISRTGDYFNPSVFPGVSGAAVCISDDDGNTVLLSESAPGFYGTPDIRGIQGRTYSLRVEVEGETYTATSTMPEHIYIDNLRCYYKDEVKNEAGEKESNYEAACFFTDRMGVDDYCRIVFVRNSDTLSDYHLYNGKWSDGNRISYVADGFREGDTVLAGLFSMDEQMFDYFWTLQSVIASDGGGLSGWAPANPNTNLSNGALGYFGAFSVTGSGLIIYNVAAGSGQ